MTEHQPTTICEVLHSLDVGGAEVLAARLAQKMQDRYRFIFACLDRLGPLGEQLRSEGFHIELFNRRTGIDFSCARRLGRFFRQQQVDIVHAHQYTPFAYALMAGIATKRPPVVFTEHGRWFPDIRRSRRVWFNRLLLRRRDRIIGVGHSVRQALIDNEGLPASRVQVIYNGINLAARSQSACDRDQMRRELDLAPHEFVVVQVARLDPLKDHLTAIRTIERAVKQHSSLRLLIVGDGPKRPQIESEIARRNLQSHIRLLGLRRDVARLLPAADALLLTSISEGIPLTAIEAMAAGLPVISTDVGGVSEVVCHGETGLLAPAKNDAALASALLQLAGDRAMCNKLGTAGLCRANDIFCEQNNHQTYARVFDEVLA